MTTHVFQAWRGPVPECIERLTASTCEWAERQGYNYHFITSDEIHEYARNRDIMDYIETFPGSNRRLLGPAMTDVFRYELMSPSELQASRFGIKEGDRRVWLDGDIEVLIEKLPPELAEPGIAAAMNLFNNSTVNNNILVSCGHSPLWARVMDRIRLVYERVKHLDDVVPSIYHWTGPYMLTDAMRCGERPELRTPVRRCHYSRVYAVPDCMGQGISGAWFAHHWDWKRWIKRNQEDRVQPIKALRHLASSDEWSYLTRAKKRLSERSQPTS